MNGSAACRLELWCGAGLSNDHGRKGKYQLKQHIRLLAVFGSVLVLVVMACAGMMVARQGLIRKIDAERVSFLKQGWTVSWRVSGFSPFSVPWQVTLRDVRLEGPLKDSHLVYGGDAVILSPTGPFSSSVRMDFTGPQALLLGHDPDHPDLAFRLTGNGVRATAFPVDDGKEIHASLSADDDRLEVHAMPFRFADPMLPFSIGLKKLQGRTVWYLKQSRVEGMAADMTISSVSLPVAWPGVGNLAERVHVAFSATGMQEEDRKLTVHIGEARFGAASFSVTGKLVLQHDAVGDFDLTLHGLEKIVDAMVAARAVTPDVRRMTLLIERFRAQGNLQPLSDVQKAGDSAAPDTIIDLPLRLRNGEWMVGALPAATLLEAWRSGKDGQSFLHQ
ncbi:DUF2125 domain-containing protein [Acetobacter sp.]|uniref:DUF2125 domain-containing protein n=1 Tax=Acetobacter sp. TaxID=440 RepID=UPI0025B7F629|nr:DUF2125 domain-containing protein [Acetobacter sp.]MCH4090942.1 DUF2125 domain-containing protein [Acetobacter sp.]MCI1300783.1 DUF2125 domain-containing protein [Acetobacter sp.]MCI1317112.1 DUF2125 domain-containing protein [Acetobacter sp.]